MADSPMWEPGRRVHVITWRFYKIVRQIKGSRIRPKFVLIFQASDAAVEYCQFVGTNVLLLRLEIVKLL